MNKNKINKTKYDIKNNIKEVKNKKIMLPKFISLLIKEIRASVILKNKTTLKNEIKVNNKNFFINLDFIFKFIILYIPCI